jgi:hypothetical protein
MRPPLYKSPVDGNGSFVEVVEVMAHIAGSKRFVGPAYPSLPSQDRLICLF